MQAPTVLVLSSHQLISEVIEQAAVAAIQSSKCLRAAGVAQARQFVNSGPVDLLVACVDSAEGDVLEFIATCAASRETARSVFVVIMQPSARILIGLRSLPVSGVFDSASEGLGRLGAALRDIHDGRPYWSASLRSTMPTPSSAAASMCLMLTPQEQLVLAVIGDGSDDGDAAPQLGLTPSTIASTRREIHRKLGVRHRGELVRFAAMLGFVSFTSGRVERPGLSLLQSACRPRRSRKAFSLVGRMVALPCASLAFTCNWVAALACELG